MNRQGKALGKLLIALVVLAVVVLAVAGVVGSNLNKRDTSGYSADLSGYESAAFRPAGNGFAAVSDVSCRLYGIGGEVLCTAARSYPDVQIATAEGYAAVWSEGGTSLTLLQADGPVDISVVGGVTAADVNGEGTLAVLAGEVGYKGSVSVVAPDGTALYRVYVGSGYPLDADVSPDSRSVAILTMTAEGSSVLIYGVNSEELAAEYREEGRSCFELEYLGDGRILLLASDGAVFLKNDGKRLGSLSFDGGYLKDYGWGDGFAALLLGRYQAGSASCVVLTDTAGTPLKSLDIEGEVQGLHAAGKYLAVRCSDRTLVYDSELNELGCLESSVGVQAAMMRSTGSAVIISGGEAAVFEP